MKNLRFSLPICGWILPMLMLLSLPALQGQNFQRQFGTSFDNVFTRVIQDGTHYYVLGQDQPGSGATSHATVTRLDANGIQLWTLSLDMPSIWNDAVVTPSGDLLVVGNTLPADATNQSLMGLVTSSSGGQFTWVRSYDVPGREANIRIIKNPAPQNASFPYYVVGGQFDPSGSNALWDDIFLLNINAAGNFNWKKKFPSTADDEFGRDLEALPNGNMLLSGNLGSAGVIIEVTNAGAIVSGATPTGLSFTYADVVQSSGGGYYAVGNTFPSITNYLMKYDQNLIGQWEANISSLSTVRSVWEDSSTGDLFVTGDWNVGGATRTVVLKIKEIANAPVLQWVRYLENSEFAYSTGYTSLLPSGVLAYADGRVPSINGFGSLDAFISISDLDMNTCMTEEDFININPAVFTYDAPNVLDMEFFDFSNGTDLTSAAINYQQEAVCSEPCQADFIITHIGQCGHYQVTNTSTGVAPLTYQWCDGQTTEHLDVMLPCGPHTFCLTITDATGCTSEYTETITVSDPIKPTALCVPSFSVVLDTSCQYIVTPGLIDGGSFDNCQIQSLSASPAILTGCGTFPVTLVVTDWCGNTNSCTTDIQTYEDVPPILVCPANVTATATTTSPCSAVVQGLSFISATDNCGTPFVDYVVTGATSNFGQNDASGLTYNQGVSTVTYTATDACGNTASCSFTVTVLCLPLCDTLSIILNTGWDNLNAVVISPSFTHLDLDGAPGLDWIVIADPITTPPPGGRPANVPVNQNGPSWANPFQNSQWICSAPDWYTVQLPNPPYLFTYEITFDLPPGYFNPNIDLQMRADELIHTVSLNNNVIYQFFPPQVAGGFNGPPLLVNNNTPSFFQTTQNKLTVSYSDESGGVTGFNLAGKVTYCKDTCTCGSFSDMAIRFERGPGMPLTCGGPPVLIDCPPTGYTYSITGKFECQGKACPLNTPFDAQLELPSGQVIHYQGQSANPYFGIPISNLDLQQAGVYTVSFTGHCGTEECKCVVRFQVDSPCLDVCPCTIPDIQAFSAAVNQGFAQVLYTKSCKACFTPIALDNCATVDWYLTNTTGTPIGSSVGNNSFCYLFPGSGTYTVIMVATRKKPDGTNCETFVKSQTVTITCLIWDECSDSVFDNPSFGVDAVEGDLDAGGHSSGWKKMKPTQPKTEADKRTGSFDGWAIDLEGNLESSGILTRIDPVCIERDSGLITVRIAVNDSGVQVAAKKAPDRPCDRLLMRVFRGDNFDIDLTNCNGVDCYELASIPLSDLDTGWHELQIPYNLKNWLAQDDCGLSGAVLIRPAVFVTNALMSSQGGTDTYSHAQLDNFCFGGMIVAVENPPPGQDFKIYPNPNTGDFTLDLPSPAHQGMSLRIVNLTGQIMLEPKIVPGSVVQTIEATDLAEGIYFLQVISSGQTITVKKFVKQ